MTEAGKMVIKPGKYYVEFGRNGYVDKVLYEESFRQLLGYETEAEYANTQDSWLISVHPDDMSRVKKHFAACTRKHPEGMDFDIEYRIMTKNGYRWVHDYATIVRWQDGSPMRAHGVVFDIQIAVYQDAQLEERPDNMKRLMNTMQAFASDYDPIIVIEPYSGEYDWYMREVVDVTDVTSMAIHGENLYKNIVIDSIDIIHEDDQEQFRKFYSRENLIKIAETGIEQETENRWFIKTDGRYHWKYNRVFRMVDESGKVFVVCGVKDTTGEKEKEAAHQRKIDEQNAYTTYFLKTYISAYYIGLDDLSFDFYKWPEYLEKKYPLISSYIDSLGKFIATEVHPDDREKTGILIQPQKLKKLLAEKEEIRVDYRLISGAEEKVHQAVVIRGADENHAAFGFRDITGEVREQREYQQALAAALEKAEIANKSKSSFLFNMSHDIRTPMNAITGFTLMAKKYLQDKARVEDYLNKIDASGQQLLSLVNQVLEMSRIESGRIEFDNQPLNIKEKYDSLVMILAAQAGVNGLEFNASLNGIKHWNVLADEARMGQITLNITGNALKYTTSGGKVDFSLTEIPCDREGWARYIFTVADTGIGMSEEFQKRLFEPFAREKSSTVSKIQGTGLGMAIVKELVDLLGGKIEVQSELGKGTRFDITIDFEIIDEPTEKEEKTALSTSFGGKRVLLVEDNELNREIAKDVLEEFGMIVEEADDGDVALNMVKAVYERGDYRYYDIILMDIQMPNMNGYDTTRAIRALSGPAGWHQPIIAMTANAFEEDRQNAFAAGMDGHLAKPIDIGKLLAMLARFL